MFEELLAIAKSGETFTKEQLEQLKTLDKNEKDKVMKAFSKAGDKRLNNTINREFKRVYKKMKIEDPETAEWLSTIVKIDEDDDNNFNNKYHDDKNYSLNEVMIAVIKDPDTPKEVYEQVRERLYLKNIGLIGYQLKRYSNKDDGKMTMEDLGQDCREQFFKKAVDRFELDKKTKFSTFATSVIRNFLASLHTNKINKRRAIEVSFETPVVDDGGSVKTLLDYQVDDTPTAADNIRKECENEILYNALNELTLEQKFVAYCRYGLGGVPKKTQKEIADYMHMSQANVSKIEGNMRTKLKQILDEVGMF